MRIPSPSRALVCIATGLLFFFLFWLPFTTQAQSSAIVINELLPNPLYGSEWVELYNAGTVPVDVTGWQLDDNDSNSPPTIINSTTVIHGDPPTALRPGSHLVVELANNWLNNDSDTVVLLTSNAIVIDQYSYSNVSPTYDRSFARLPDGQEWSNQSRLPTQGYANSGPAPTPRPTRTFIPTPTTTPTHTARPATATSATKPTTVSTTQPTKTTTPSIDLPDSPQPASSTQTNTPTATNTATSTSTPTSTPFPMPPLLLINEVLPSSRNNQPEWLELYNPGPTSITLDGWLIDILGTTRNLAIPPQSIPPGGYTVLSDIRGRVLPADGGKLILRDQWGQQVGATLTYPALSIDQSYARTTDGGTIWTTTYPPSPGGPNLPATPTPTFTPSPTHTATPEPQLLLLNELVAAPPPGQAEWIELYNPSPTTLALAGWTLQRTSPSGTIRTHALPDQTIAATGLMTVALPSGLLPNGGATLQLSDPLDRPSSDPLTYPALQTNQGYARTSNNTWATDYPLSPGQPNLPPLASPTPSPTNEILEPFEDIATATPSPTPTPTIQPAPLINELLAAPSSGQVEWIELYNPHRQTVTLQSLRIQRTSTSGAVRTYNLAESTIKALDFVVYEVPSGLLPNSGASLVLLDAQNRTLGDTVRYPRLSTNQVYAREYDGTKFWRRDYPASPRSPNLPPPITATATPTSSAAPIATEAAPTSTPTPTATRTPTPTKTAPTNESRPSATTIAQSTAAATEQAAINTDPEDDPPPLAASSSLVNPAATTAPASTARPLPAPLAAPVAAPAPALQPLAGAPNPTTTQVVQLSSHQPIALRAGNITPAAPYQGNVGRPYRLLTTDAAIVAPTSPTGPNHAAVSQAHSMLQMRAALPRLELVTGLLLITLGGGSVAFGCWQRRRVRTIAPVELYTPDDAASPETDEPPALA